MYRRVTDCWVVIDLNCAASVDRNNRKRNDNGGDTLWENRNDSPSCAGSYIAVSDQYGNP
jgi:hypothetical protein